jgi:hypothetical protein
VYCWGFDLGRFFGTEGRRKVCNEKLFNLYLLSYIGRIIATIKSRMMRLAGSVAHATKLQPAAPKEEATWEI